MSSSTILRVKRRLEDNPQEVFVITCKRLKTDVSELSPSLFVFRGTVNDQDNIQVKDFPPKENVKLKPEINVDRIMKKIRKEHKDISNEQRYQIVKFSRGLTDETDESKFDLVDLEEKMKDNINEDEQYIYDLYTTEKSDFNISSLDELVSIENYTSELIYGSHRDNGRSTPSDEELSDDSNDENHWKNDYPDTEPSSIDEDDMVRAVERCDLDDLSSDDGEDQIYSDNVNANFADDVLHYGSAYAKYKARVLAEESDMNDSKGLVHCSKVKEMDEESINGYKDDEDDGFYYGQHEDTEQFIEQYKDNRSSDECDPD